MYLDIDNFLETVTNNLDTSLFLLLVQDTELAFFLPIID